MRILTLIYHREFHKTAHDSEKHTSNHFMALCPRLLGEPVPEETFTHSHLSRSSITLHQLSPFTTGHSIFPVQFTCLTVFMHNLYPSLLWSTSWCGALHFILHTFLHPIIVFFLQHMPIPSQSVFLKYQNYII